MSEVRYKTLVNNHSGHCLSCFVVEKSQGSSQPSSGEIPCKTTATQQETVNHSYMLTNIFMSQV